MIKSVAIVGASADRNKFGNKAVRAYLRAGWRVFPVHPTANEIEGLPVYRSIADVPEPSLDRISIYLPPHVCIKVLEQIAPDRAKEIMLNPGSDSPEVLEAARARNLPVVTGCSIIAVGQMPEA